VFAVNLIRKNKMLSVAVLAAVVTMFFVPPDRVYLSYFDVKTLVCLFCMLLIVHALSNIDFFEVLSHRVICVFSDLRAAVFVLVFITLVGSMLITNDMALIAFLPLGFFILKSAGELRFLPLVFIIQTMAANLGGMLTPFGNPQNLYLFSFYKIPVAQFLFIMLLPFCVSVFLTFSSCFFVKRKKLAVPQGENALNIKLTVIYLLLFAVAVAAIVRVIPYPAALIAPAVILFTDKKAIREADYPLIGTFCAFFVFSGNLSRISAVTETLGAFVNGNTLLTSIAVSQVISNVPAAILLSKFTENFPALLVGVNIGGAGTPIASLASLITIRLYNANGGEKKPFAALYAAFNIVFLAILTAVCVISGR
jgi:Na+/H+ antiporter NhaD/arsenite permease-like protein